MANSNDTDIAKVLQDSLNVINDYQLELGVFTLKSSRKVRVGVNNAELMFVHENGSPLRSIPSRPVLKMTLEYANKHLVSDAISKCIDLVLSGRVSEVEIELNKLAMRIENYARKLIYSNDGRLVANAASTIAKKGTNHPLFDTGQLARSITCRVVKK